MENDIVQVLTYSLVIIALGGANAYVLARGLPQVALAYDAFWQTVASLIPWLRRLFDPDTVLARSLKAKGIDPAVVDKIVEMTADMLTELVKPYVPEPETLDNTPGAGEARS